MKEAEKVFSKSKGFSLIGDNESITLTKSDIYEAMEKYAMPLIKQLNVLHKNMDIISDIAIDIKKDYADAIEEIRCTSIEELSSTEELIKQYKI